MSECDHVWPHTEAPHRGGCPRLTRVVGAGRGEEPSRGRRGVAGIVVEVEWSND